MTDIDKAQYAASLKHPDVEEPIDLWFYRPVGFRVALLGRRMGWTPNMITVASIFLGVGCGLLCYPDDLLLNISGMLLLVMADVCDSADGQLARLTHQYSALGRILDGAAGDVWFITIYLALFFRLFPLLGWWAFAFGVLAGLSHRQQAALADYYRQVHLFMVRKADAASHTVAELSDADTEQQRLQQLSLMREPVQTIFQWFYVGYTRFQESATPCWQRLRRARRDGVGWPAADAERFRQLSRPLMPMANALTFNCRAIVLFVAMLTGLPWLYWAMEVTVFNILYFYMKSRHERICRQAFA